MRFEKVIKEHYTQGDKPGYCTYEEIKLPKRGTRLSAGYDIYSVCNFTLYPGDTITVPTGIKFKCDDDKFLLVVPRSGHGFKYGTMLVNTVGIIDADYYGNSKNDGHMYVKIHYPEHHINDEPYVVHIGDAICQGIISPYYKVEDDEADGIRDGGFGSTGN